MPADSALAVRVVNQTTGVTLFESDGLENDALGSPPAVTSTGSWVAYPPHDVVVNAASPGPAHGTKYLSTTRTASGAGGPRAFFTSQEMAGHQIKMSFRLYLPVNADSALILENNDTFYRALGRITGGFYHNYNGSAYVNTGLTYTGGEWQQWEVEYTVGATSYLVRIGNNSITAPTLNGLSTPGGGSVNAISFAHNGLATYYIDGAPPPPPPPPPNDDCANAVLLTTQPLSASTAAATSDGTSVCGNSAGSPDVWYRYTATYTGQIIVDTCGSAFDTVVSAYSGAGCPGTELTCNNNCTGSSCGSPDSCATVSVTAGQSYHFRVAGANGATGTFTIRLQELKPITVDWQVGPSLPQGLQDSDGGVIHNTLISVGGFCSGIPGDQAIKPGVYPRGFLKKAWGLDLSNRAAGWATLPDFPGVARQGLFAAVADDALYVWGGFNYDAPYCYQDGYRLRRVANVWMWDVLPSLPWRLTSAAPTVIGSKIYVMGGADYDGVVGFHTLTDRNGGVPRLGARLLVLDTQNLVAGWQELTQCPGTPRFVHAAAVGQGKIFVFGGATGGSPTCTVVDNWKYDPSNDQWTRMANLPIASGNFPRGSEIAYQARYVLLPGGYQYGCVANPDGSTGPPYGTPTSHLDQPYTYGVFYNDVFVYDMLTNVFSRTNLMPLNNNLPMTVVHGDEVFCIGGETGGASVYGEYFGHHPELCLVGQIAISSPPTVNPDFDADLDVDQIDFAHLQACFTDPLVPPTSECDDADLNDDNKVDVVDFDIFNNCMSGPGLPALAGCDLTP